MSCQRAEAGINNVCACFSTASSATCNALGTSSIEPPRLADPTTIVPPRLLRPSSDPQSAVSTAIEFEAVFFVGIDELAARQPQLFDKYLYVGATRAATYLGITCSSAELPGRIAPLEKVFANSWH